MELETLSALRAASPTEKLIDLIFRFSSGEAGAKRLMWSLTADGHA